VNPTAAASPDLPGHESCHKFRELSWKNSQKFMETHRLVEHERAREDHKRNNDYKSHERERERKPTTTAPRQRARKKTFGECRGTAGKC
jgi:hypothetical protein